MTPDISAERALGASADAALGALAPPRRFPPLPGSAAPAAAHRSAAALAGLTQGSAAWIAARVGLVTASRLADVVARTKTGYGAARAAYLTELLAERLTGRPAEPYLTPAMAWGRRHEAGARAAYEFFRGVDVDACGFVLHPTVPLSGASPDGLVGDDGLLEVKCPTTAAHLDVVLKGVAPERHVAQMQWQMACSGRGWCDYVSYDPRLPEPTRVVILRIGRDDARIAALEDEVRAFLDELDAREAEIRAAASAGGAAAPHPRGEAPQRQAAAPEAPVDLGGAPAAAAVAESRPASLNAAPAAPNPPADDEQRRPYPRGVVDLGSGARKALTPRQRLALYEAHGGICCICGNRIVGSRWVDEHVRPLSLGGSNDVDNRAPAHERCAQEKTRDDLRRLAKAKAQKRAFLGLKAATRLIAARPFPASDRIRPDLSPLGPPRAGRLLAGQAPNAAAPDPDDST